MSKEYEKGLKSRSDKRKTFTYEGTEYKEIDVSKKREKREKIKKKLNLKHDPRITKRK
jgi:hypothetical protein